MVKKAKKKIAKKSIKKKAVKKAVSFSSFEDWWTKVAQKQVEKIEKDWIKQNEPNDPEDDGGGDHWHVNQMMHDGEAFNMTYEIAERVFALGVKGEEWTLTMSDGLFCELDDVICDAYEAGKKLKG